MPDGTRYGSRAPQRADHWRAVKGGYENCCAGDCVLAIAKKVVEQDQELLQRLAHEDTQP